MLKADHAREKLRTYIRDCSDQGMLRLPTERELARMFNVSRSTIGKALSQLDAEGLVMRCQGRGTFIASDESERTHCIAICMRRSYNGTDTHFLKMVTALSTVAEKLGVRVQVFDRLNDQTAPLAEDSQLRKEIEAGRIEGAVIISRMPLETIMGIAHRVPVVVLNSIFGYGEYPSFTCDYWKAGFLAARHFLQQGHRRLGYVCEEPDMVESIMSLSGYRGALEAEGIDLPEDRILFLRKNDYIRREQIDRFFRDSDCTGVFVRNTRLSALLYRHLTAQGWEIPTDLSLLSIGKYDKGILCPLTLSIIDNRLDEMCRLGLESLTSLIQDEPPQSGITLLDPFLSEGKSVCRPSELAVIGHLDPLSDRCRTVK
jgi:GntR family transcriptional regulator, arabinose operon transcriptional repressor